jgi:hypothetical protein
MPVPLSRCIKFSALFLLVNIPLFGKGFRVVFTVQDSVVKMSGLVLDTLLEQPDTMFISAKIILESLPHGNEVGIITSNERGYYEYYANMAYTYSITVESEGHRKYSEVFDPRLALKGAEITRNFYLEPELKENQVIRLNKLIFEQGKASITPTSFQELNRLVTIMDENSAGRAYGLQGQQKAEYGTVQAAGDGGKVIPDWQRYPDKTDKDQGLWWFKTIGSRAIHRGVRDQQKGGGSDIKTVKTLITIRK